MSNDGYLRCFNKYTGSQLWSVAVNLGDNGNGGSGHCASPLVEGDLVILNIAKAGMAVRRTAPHDIVWSSAFGTPSFASPVPFTDDEGQRRVAIFSKAGLHLLNIQSGIPLAQTPWPGNMTIPDPIVWGNKIFLATGELSCYSGLVEYSNRALRTVWQNPQNIGMNTKTANFVRLGDYVYGACYLDRPPGSLKCLRLSNGNEMWSEAPCADIGNHSTAMAVGNHILFLTSFGLYVAKATPEKLDLEGRPPLKVYSNCATPAFADGRLYFRQSEKLICFDARIQPEMDLWRGSSPVFNGGTDRSAGSEAGKKTLLTYTIKNTCLGPLVMTVPVGPPADLKNCLASVKTQPPNSVAAGSSATMAVEVTPTASGAWSFTLSIANNDSDENPYHWSISGTANQGEIEVFRGMAPVGDGGFDRVSGSMARAPTSLTRGGGVAFGHPPTTQGMLIFY